MIRKIENACTGFQTYFASYIPDETLKSVEEVYNKECVNPEYEPDFRAAYLGEAADEEEAQRAFGALVNAGWIEFRHDEDSIVVCFNQDGGERLPDIEL